ncbi:MAG: hypothetical protein WA324_08545 [Bryobacteraceae bacterium]
MSERRHIRTVKTLREELAWVRKDIDAAAAEDGNSEAFEMIIDALDATCTILAALITIAAISLPGPKKRKSHD